MDKIGGVNTLACRCPDNIITPAHAHFHHRKWRAAAAFTQLQFAGIANLIANERHHPVGQGSHQQLVFAVLEHRFHINHVGKHVLVSMLALNRHIGDFAAAVLIEYLAAKRLPHQLTLPVIQHFCRGIYTFDGVRHG